MRDSTGVTFPSAQPIAQHVAQYNLLCSPLKRLHNVCNRLTIVILSTLLINGLPSEWIGSEPINRLSNVPGSWYEHCVVYSPIGRPIQWMK